MEQFIKLILCFVVYSFLGWLMEGIYCSILSKKIINRGFLNGPICPVYGFGALLVIYLLSQFKGNILTLFVIGVVVTSIVEYLTSIILEMAFQTRWWDYSRHKFNLHGRVYLLNSLLFGLMAVALVEVVHVKVINIIGYIPSSIRIILVLIIITLLVVDIVTTLMAMVNLNNKLRNFSEMESELNTMNIKFIKLDDNEWKRVINKLTFQKKPQHIIDKVIELESKLKNHDMKSILQKRIVMAFPNMKHKKYQEQFKHFKDFIGKKIKNK